MDGCTHVHAMYNILHPVYRIKAHTITYTCMPLSLVSIAAHNESMFTQMYKQSADTPKANSNRSLKNKYIV